MTMEQIDVLILGAGVAGLGAALRCRELNRRAVILEARESAGGLLDNFVIDGFRFDHAVHLSFAKEPKVREIFDQTPYLTHPADSTCFDQGTWFKHPVQNNLFPLPAQEKVALIESFLGRRDAMGEDNYENWLRHQYGDALAERYPIRYTRKYWASEAASLSTTWIGDRMRRAQLGEILYGAFTDDTPNHYYTKEMRYPVEGGYKAFIQPLIDAAEIRLGRKVVRIDTRQRIVRCANGDEIQYGQLVSTLPLPVMTTLLEDVPAAVGEAARHLVASSIDLVSVGFRRQVVRDLWFYIYDEDIMASRAYAPSIKSPANVPAGCSSLQFEAYSRGPRSQYDAQALKENTAYALQKMGIGTADDILFMDHRHVPYGNVIFDIGMEDHRDVVRRHLLELGIASRGRFGEWDYLWSNQSLLSGYHWPEAL